MGVVFPARQGERKWPTDLSVGAGGRQAQVPAGTKENTSPDCASEHLTVTMQLLKHRSAAFTPLHRAITQGHPT